MSRKFLGQTKKGLKYLIDIVPKDEPRYREVIYCGSEVEAAAYEDRMREEIGASRKKAGVSYDIAYIAQKYLDWTLAEQAEATYRDRKRMLEVGILPFFGKMFPDQITLIMINDFIKKRIEQIGLKQRELQLEKICLYGMISWAVDHKLCAHELPRPKKSRGKTAKKKKNKRLPKFLTKEEVQLIIDNMKSMKHRTLYSCCFMAGLRSDEVRHLEWSGVSFDPPRIRFIGKNDKERMVPMSKKLTALMRAWYAEKECKDQTYCFPSRVKRWKGKDLDGALTDIRAPLEYAIQKAGFNKKVTPHMFRHSFATHLLRMKKSIRQIQVLMGHEDISTTTVYLGVDDDQKTECVEAFDDENDNE